MALPTPLFVPIIEEGLSDHPVADLMIDAYLAPLRAHPRVDTLTLGCTHYPLIKTKIQNYVGERIHVIDSAQPTALALKRMLAEQHMRSPEARPTQVYFTSDDPSRSMNIAENFLGEPLELEKLAL